MITVKLTSAKPFAGDSDFTTKLSRVAANKTRTCHQFQSHFFPSLQNNGNENSITIIIRINSL
jgi:hypothetical protein